MADDLSQLETWAAPLLARLNSQERRAMMRDLAIGLRKRQSDRIKKQENPDSSSFVPRKSNRVRSANPPIRFLYKKPNGISRIVYMRSWQNNGLRITGFDREANGIRTILKSRIEHYLPTPSGSGQTLRNKKGRIKQKMFQRLTQPKFFKMASDINSAAVGFNGNAADIAEIHQLGLKDEVNNSGLEYDYPKRELLGFSNADRQWVNDFLVDRLTR